MIVEKMTPNEVYRELDKDLGNSTRWHERQMKLHLKRARNSIHFPIYVWHENKTSRGNRYLVLFHSLTRRYSNTLTLALQKAERGYKVYIARGANYLQDVSPMVIMPHVFDRYAERNHLSLTGVELIKQMARNLSDGVIMDDNRLSGKSVRYKGRDNICMSIHDGVLLGEVSDGVFIAHTYITYDMTIGLQRETFLEKRGKLRTEKEMLDDARKYYGEDEEDDEAQSLRTLVPMDTKALDKVRGDG